MLMSGGYLRRYTQLPSLLYMLSKRKLTLLDPQSWDDRNDSYYLQQYKEKKGLQSVLALCFTLDSETYHHWSVFAHGSAGVCVEFKRNEFVAAMTARRLNLRPELVTYLKLPEIRRKPPGVDDLPFVKRYAFRHEKEFRLVFTSKKREYSTLDIPVSLRLIARITLSPWLPKTLYDQVRGTLKGIPGCRKVSIVRSTLISNQEWKGLGKNAV
jgi:hypothetical protein